MPYTKNERIKYDFIFQKKKNINDRSKLILFLLSYLELCSLFITSIPLLKKKFFFSKFYLFSIRSNMERLNEIVGLLMFIGNYLLDHHLRRFRRRCQEFQSRTATRSDRMDNYGLECDFCRFHFPVGISNNCSPKETAIQMCKFLCIFT